MGPRSLPAEATAPPIHRRVDRSASSPGGRPAPFHWPITAAQFAFTLLCGLYLPQAALGPAHPPDPHLPPPPDPPPTPAGPSACCSSKNLTPLCRILRFG